MSFVSDYLGSYEKRRWRLENLAGLSSAVASSAFAAVGTTLWCSERGDWIVPDVPDSYPELEWAYRLSQYYHGEVFAADVYEQLLASPTLDAETRRLSESVWSDERQHVEVLQRYLMQRLGGPDRPGIFDHAPGFKAVCDQARRSGDLHLMLATLHLVVEPAGVASMATSVKYIADEQCLQMLQRVLGDEAHHLQVAPHHLAGLPRPTRERLVRWLTLAIGAMRHAAVPRQAYRYALPHLHDTLVEQAEQSPALRNQARRTALALVRACRGTALQADAGELALALRSSYQPELIESFLES